MKLTILKQIVPLAVVCSVLLGYQYMGATWNDPSQAAPDGNTDAPINTGATAQVKNGALSVDALAVFGDVLIDGAGTLIVSNVCNADRSTCGTVEEFLAGGSGGGGSTGLFAGQHTPEQCTALGGEVVTAGTEQICRFDAFACPAGWAQLNSWSTTLPRSCNGTGWWGCGISSPTTGSHAWSNTPVEQNSYRTNGQKEDGDAVCASYSNAVCSAIVDQVGCY